MGNKVIIYSGENCSNCKIVKSFMDSNKIQYEVRDIANEEYKAEMISKGFMSIPVLVVNGEYHLVNTSNFIGVLKDVL